MSQQQGQNALADTPKTDDNEAPMEGDVLHVKNGNQMLTGLTKPVRSEQGVVKSCPRQPSPQRRSRTFPGGGIGSAQRSAVQPPLWRPRNMSRLAAAIVVGVALAPAMAFAQAKASKASGYDRLSQFGEAFERIRQDAVEPVIEAKLIGAAIAGMLSALDARSVYISEAAFRTSQTPSNNEAGTLGLVLTIGNGQLRR
jgi:hypothetical protein